MRSARRAEALSVVETIGARLASPERVLTVTTAPGNAVEMGSTRESVWAPATLGDGYPGVALLLAELAADDPRCRAAAHAHLAAAVSAGRDSSRGLFHGAGAIAFAAHAAGTVHGGYTGLLDTLDTAIAVRARRMARVCRDRAADGRPLGSWHTYDVIGGAVGIGRYLMLRTTATGSTALAADLVELVDALAQVATGPEALWYTDSDGPHLNLGLAHGVAGPLGLFALVHEAGMSVPRIATAADRVVRILLRWRHDDAAGPYWPRRAISEDDVMVRERDAWCHGAAGIGRVLYVAGRSFHRPEWTELGQAAILAAVPPRGGDVIRDAALCHGWAGLLQITVRMLLDTGDPRYASIADQLANRLLDEFDPAAAFGYRFAHPGSVRPLDRPGLLDGAAGVALALRAYATTRRPRVPWDAALLLA